jgi:hypothetical protein
MGPNHLKVFFLLPFMILVRLLAWLDPHLWRHRDVKSWRNWLWMRWTWVAYALALAGWIVLFGGVGIAVHWLEPALHLSRIKWRE